MDLANDGQQAEPGRRDSREAVLQAAYQDLRRLAAAKMARERADHTLTSTALVNEASMKVLDDSNLPLTSRPQFFCYVSKVMRNLLIDHARAKSRLRRGGDLNRAAIDDAHIATEPARENEVLAVNEALDQLALIDERKAKVVELRFFGGLTNEEVASALELSVATVKRDWDVAKAWLKHSLAKD